MIYAKKTDDGHYDAWRILNIAKLIQDEDTRMLDFSHDQGLKWPENAFLWLGKNGIIA